MLVLPGGDKGDQGRHVPQAPPSLAEEVQNRPQYIHAVEAQLQDTILR